MPPVDQGFKVPPPPAPNSQNTDQRSLPNVTRERGRSSSAKRLRDENGQAVDTSRSQPRTPRKQTCVVGTSSSSDRKLKSPPVDIFLGGVHPDNTPDDIVADLPQSSISDIVKNSKPEAFLVSYKISAKAEHLSKSES